ncbi:MULTISPECIES: hypothetical protein [Providencia]|uniref:hypothetical protein n=1 Tax=Providencia TaxID=586 RepID=UPI0014199AE9|nr:MULTISPECIES: hypothetical protein [Providencia]NIH03630.1 hypothetical protein [Providencia rettgeri]
MGSSRSDSLKQQEFLFKCNELIKGGERELVYYIHHLQEDSIGQKYISNIDYGNIKDIRKQVKNALIRIKDECMIFYMQDDYEEFACDEINFGWLKNDSRACFHFLLEILIKGDSYRYKIENENYINLDSNSIYYSIIAFFDKSKQRLEDYRPNYKLEEIMHDSHTPVFQNSVFPWLSKLHDSDEIKYCLNYLRDSVKQRFTEDIMREDIDFFIRLSDKYSINKKYILIALFDFLYKSSFSGGLAAENLKMKMANALSSWKNRRNKEGYVDVHFDIKKENIPKLEALKKRFNLMSKKEVVNALIEREYDKKG